LDLEIITTWWVAPLDNFSAKAPRHVTADSACCISFNQARTIDGYHLVINPTAIGSGMTIFKEVDNRLNLSIIKSQSVDCGIVVLH
jgi:hypothetical protein